MDSRARSRIGRRRETTRRQARARSPANPRLLPTRPPHPDDRHHSGLPPPPRTDRRAPAGLPAVESRRPPRRQGRPRGREFGVIRSARPSPVTSARLMPRYGSPPTSIDAAPENVPSPRPRNSRMDPGDRSSTRRSAWPSESMSCSRTAGGCDETLTRSLEWSRCSKAPPAIPKSRVTWSVSWFATARSASPSPSRSAMARSTGFSPAAPDHVSSKRPSPCSANTKTLWPPETTRSSRPPLFRSRARIAVVGLPTTASRRSKVSCLVALGSGAFRARPVAAERGGRIRATWVRRDRGVANQDYPQSGGTLHGR